MVYTVIHSQFTEPGRLQPDQIGNELLSIESVFFCFFDINKCTSLNSPGSVVDQITDNIVKLRKIRRKFRSETQLSRVLLTEIYYCV